MATNQSQSKAIIIGITAEQFITNFKDPQSNLLITRKNKYAVSLLNKQSPINYDTIKVETNKTYLDQIVANVSAIPTIVIPPFELKDDVFHAEPIDVLPDDSKGLKQDIRRFNRKIASWTCDHSKLRSTKLLYQHDAYELGKSNNFKAVKDYILSMSNACIALENKDRLELDYIHDSPKRDFSDDEDDYLDDGREDRLIDTDKAEQVVEAANNFKSEILAFLAKYQQTECPICARHKSEYENMLREVEERRQEAKDEYEKRRQEAKVEYEREIKKIQDSVDENIDDFMNQYFPGKTKLKVMIIVKMWKLVKKEMIKQDEIVGMLKETGKWTISNTHNIKYAQHK